MTTHDAPAPSPVRHLIVQGKVQGVGFRWYVRERARRLGVAGWVRNEPDGSVRVMVGGPAHLVSRFIDEMRLGPPNAIIDAIREERVALATSDRGESSSSLPPTPPPLPYPFEIRR